MISSERVSLKHVMGMIKRFNSASDAYRDRSKIFSLIFSFISGIYNFELGK